MKTTLRIGALLTSLGLFIAGAALAQPVVNSSFYGGAVGNSFRFGVQDLQSLPSIATGPNAAWNYNYSGGLTSTVTVLPYNQGTGRDSFPRQTLVYRGSIPGFGTSDAYIGSTASGLYSFGSADDSSSDVIHGGQMLIPYGFSVGQSTSYSHYEYVTSPDFGTDVYRLDDSLTYKGWGSLTLGSRVYRNVILIERTSRSYFFQNGQFGLEEIYTDNMFFAQGVGFPVLILEKNTYFGSGTPDESFTANFASNVTTDAAPRLPVLALQAYPNPAQDHITLRLPAHLAGKPGTAVLTNLQGAEVAHLPLSHAGRVNLAGLPAGVYALMLSSEEGVYRTRVVKN